jgi:osmotically-inducible protein OsmY
MANRNDYDSERMRDRDRGYDRGQDRDRWFDRDRNNEYDRQENRDFGSSENRWDRGYGSQSGGNYGNRREEEFRGRERGSSWNQSDDYGYRGNQGSYGNQGNYGNQGPYGNSSYGQQYDQRTSHDQGYYGQGGRRSANLDNDRAGIGSQGSFRAQGGFGSQGDFNPQGSFGAGSSYGNTGSGSGTFGTSAGSSSMGGLGSGHLGSSLGGGMSSGSYGSQQQGRYSGRGPKGYQRSDERIKEDISEHLTHHGEIDASEIEIQVQNGEVTLTGTVDHRQAKRLAEDVAERVSGVRDVHNHIRVSSSQSQSLTSSTSQSSSSQSHSNEQPSQENSGNRVTAGSTQTSGAKRS